MQARQKIRVLATLWLLLVSLGVFAGAQQKPPVDARGTRLAQGKPAADDSLKFAIIGDSGTGSASQYRVAEKLVASRATFPYEFVLMMGDNLYGGEGPSAYDKKFERPYKALLDSGIKFYASLGNHDEPNQRFYKAFNMNGERYYTFKPKDNIRIFALDSNYMDQAQLDWVRKELSASGSDWKIVFFHHPIYSSGGRHGSDEQLRAQLEPLFLKYGVDAVFQGHEHFYERIKPQKGIYYFISGGAAKLREGNVAGQSQLTAKSFDSGYHFMLIEITKDQLKFQAISDQAKVVDSGSLPRFNDEQKKAFAGDAALPAPKPTATTGR
jgi:predicted MPP superfamily phosphohydrolase